MMMFVNPPPNPPPAPQGQPSVYRMGEMYHGSQELKKKSMSRTTVDHTPSTISDHSITDSTPSLDEPISTPSPSEPISPSLDEPISTPSEQQFKKDKIIDDAIDDILSVRKDIDNLIVDVLDEEKKASLSGNRKGIVKYYNNALDPFFDLIENHKEDPVEGRMIFKVILWIEWNKMKSLSRFTYNKKKTKSRKKEIKSMTDISNFEYMSISTIYDLAKIEELSADSSPDSLYYYYLSQSFKASQLSEYFAGVAFFKKNDQYKARPRLKNAKDMAYKAKEYNNKAIKRILRNYDKKEFATIASKRGADIETLVEEKSSSNNMILSNKSVKERWDDKPFDNFITYLVEKEKLDHNIDTIEQKLFSL